MARSTNGGGSGPSKKRSLVRSARTRLSGKYKRQRIRTEINKTNRRAAHKLRNPNDKQV